MDFNAFLDHFHRQDPFAENIAYWHHQPARPAYYKALPDWIEEKIVRVLQNRGIEQLYSHQDTALKMIRSKKNVVITTGTASGKSLCYQLPILNEWYKNPNSTAILFFPTKALTYDQMNSFKEFIDQIDIDKPPLLAAVYDGDTPAAQRPVIRNNTRILLTNPDMLNVGILPHHTNWAEFFENLNFVIIDEIHLYRGVFGSHIANLIRRLKRILAFYGAHPQFIMTSATIANPEELAEKLIEEEVICVEEDGSPKGEKSFAIYNPSFVNEEFGIREGLLATSTKFGALHLAFAVQTLIFCNTRRFVELLLRDLKQIQPKYAFAIKGYRSGYLKKERRAIEEGLKNGSTRLVVATNALELGVDIGSMDAVVIAGYPGSICSLRQRIGRSGRQQNPSLSVLIASMNPLDQFMAKNPQYLMERPLEKALINPDNPLILLPHIKSAAFELPFSTNDSFGGVTWQVLEEYLQYLCSEGILHRKNERYYWLSDSYPSNDYSLRSTMAERILIQRELEGEVETIGEVDYTSALWMVHPGAVYLQDGLTYTVTNLDLEHSIALLEDHKDDTITEPVISQEIEPVTLDNKQDTQYYCLHFGEVKVTTQVTSYKRMKQGSGEILAIEPLDLPQVTLETTGFWMELKSECVERMRQESNWLSDANDYGKDWKTLTQWIRKRDGYRCQFCGRVEEDVAFHVHHKIPFKQFTSLEKANQPENLTSLCPSCHRLVELNSRMRSALSGLKYVMSHLAPLLVLCENTDLGASADPKSKYFDMNPVILIYDAIPAGIGLAHSLYEQIDSLLIQCKKLVDQCECEDGCPSCVGPAAEMGYGGKRETRYLLGLLHREVE